MSDFWHMLPIKPTVVVKYLSRFDVVLLVYCYLCIGQYYYVYKKVKIMSKLLRSKEKVIAGVCGGIAEYFGWDARMVRLVWLVMILVGLGSPVIFYLILCLLMPDSSNMKKSYEERMKDRLGK